MLKGHLIIRHFPSFCKFEKEGHFNFLRSIVFNYVDEGGREKSVSGSWMLPYLVIFFFEILF